MLKKQRDFLRLRHAKEHVDGIRKNPLFFRAPPKRWIMIGVGALIMTVAIASVVGLTYIPWFRLTTISVSGATILDPTAIEQHVRDTLTYRGYPLIARDNVFLVNLSKIEQRLMADFALERVDVQRNGHALDVQVKEKIMTVILRTKEKTVFLGLDGAYVRDATAEESRAIDIRIGTAEATEGEVPAPLQANVPIILDTKNDPATSLPLESVSHVLDIATLLHYRGVSVNTFTFEGAAALFTRVDTDQSYDLYFDLTRATTDQISTLATIVGKSGFTAPSEYIDLRFGAYVYVK